jgi:hypothetical protein
MWSNISMSYVGLEPNENLARAARRLAGEIEQRVGARPRFQIHIGSKPRQGRRGSEYVVRVYCTLSGGERFHDTTLTGQSRGLTGVDALTRAFAHVRDRLESLPARDVTASETGSSESPLPVAAVGGHHRVRFVQGIPVELERSDIGVGNDEGR